mgnify:CR=1 FL=1
MLRGKPPENFGRTTQRSLAGEGFRHSTPVTLAIMISVSKIGAIVAGHGLDNRCSRWSREVIDEIGGVGIRHLVDEFRSFFRRDRDQQPDGGQSGAEIRQQHNLAPVDAVGQQVT